MPVARGTMKNFGTVAISLVSLSLGLAAHAAPTVAPTPTVRPGVAPQARSIFRIEGEVIAVANKCGEPITARVKLTNKTTKPWSGVVNLSAITMKSVSVSLASEGADATKTVDLSLTTTLDCKKPLGNHNIRVWGAGGPADVVYSKALRATKVTAERPYTAPSGANTQPWLRRVVLNGACGGAISPTVYLQSSGNQPQSANVKLTFGAATTEKAVSVLNATPVTLDVPGTLDCQAATGIPAFEYALLTGNAVAGKLDAVEIMFEP